MTTEERLEQIEKKLDQLLSTLGIRESLGREAQHRVDVLAAMPPNQLVAHLKAQSKKFRGR